MGLTKKNIKSRSKKQKGNGIGCSKPGPCPVEPNNIEEEDPNTLEEYLSLAIEEELPNVVIEYLDKGADPNRTVIEDEDEFIPAIIYVARRIDSPNKTAKIMKSLIDKGASVGFNDDARTTPLIEAAEYGNLSAAKFLLSIKEVDINATSGTGATAIAYASMLGDIPMIRLILDKRRGEIDFNYNVIGTEYENVIDETTDPEIAKILKEYAIELKLPNHRERQQIRLEVGRKLDKKRMPGDLTHKIITEHFGGKTRRKKRSKKKGGNKMQKSKKVIFKKCESDMDCTLDKPECDTKNNICIQKFKYIGGKTRKKMKKTCM